jgi:hypothetical protein
LVINSGVLFFIEGVDIVDAKAGCGILYIFIGIKNRTKKGGEIPSGSFFKILIADSFFVGLGGSVERLYRA